MFTTLIDIFKTVLFFYSMLFVLSLPYMLISINTQAYGDLVFFGYFLMNLILIISFFFTLEKVKQDKRYVYLLVGLALGVIALGGITFMPLVMIGALLGVIATISLLKYPVKI